MSINIYPPLCGGTFFDLIIASRKEGPTPREFWAGVKNDNAQNPMLIHLMEVVDYPLSEIKETTLKTVASQYRNCRSATPGSLPITFPQYINAFKKQMNHDGYPKLLWRMSDFLDHVIDITNEYQREWLVRAILELLIQNPIEDDLYITEDGRPTKGSQISKIRSVQFQSFILGIWHYIVTKKVPNNIPELVFNSWAKSDTRGESVDLDFEVLLQELSEPTSAGNASPLCDEPPEEAEAEVIIEQNTPASTERQITNNWYCSPGGTQIGVVNGDIIIGGKK